MSTPAAPSFETVGLTKRFGSFTALEDASIRVRPGTFHSLLGENGAGKSTLVKCAIGYQAPTSGQVLFNDREVNLKSTRDAHALGIGMVYQQFTLVENMTVAENLVLVRDHLPAVINWEQEYKALDDFMQRQPFQVKLSTPVHSLSAGEKQKLEILKQLYLHRRLLFLDEPTSVLTPAEADEVLGLLHGLTRAQQLTVLIITHKFREVMAFADEVTILRQGKVVGGGQVSTLTPTDMAAMMMGAEHFAPTTPRTNGRIGEPRLRIERLEVVDDTGVPAVKSLSLSVHSGEIVGIAGVSGNGQTELVQVLAGQREAAHGVVTIHNSPYTATRAESRQHKVYCLPDVPLRNACAPDMSVSENIVLREFDIPPIARGKWFINRTSIRRRAQELISRYRVKTASPDEPIRNLSGGNVQRAVLARELSNDVDVLIVSNPCFGLDYSATATIRAQIVDARNHGAAVLLVSGDLDEILEIADRICVIFNGALVYETSSAEADVTTIGRYMAGHMAMERKEAPRPKSQLSPAQIVSRSTV